MALTDEQREVMNSILRLDDLGELDGPTVTIEVTKREARLLLDALDHYRKTRCPIDGKGDECAMMFWSESVHTGAMERNCIGRCDRITEELLGENVQKAFRQGRG